MPKSEAPAPKKTVRVVVDLTVEDHKLALIAAKLQKESVGQWIAGLVNMALMP